MSLLTRWFVPVLLAVLAPAALAQEWPRFRGPDGAGLSDATGIPVTFAETDFNWKVPLPGGGHSSPIVWGERVFVTCASDDAGQRTLLCLNAADGSVAWTRQFESHPYAKHGDNSYASTTPAADERHVYVCWGTPQRLTLHALTHDGKDAWTADLGPYAANHGGGASPVVLDGLVVMPNDQDRASFLVAFDAATGKERWRTPRRTDRFSASTPCVYRPPGGGPAQLVFTASAHGVTGIDPKSGAVLWEVPDAFDSRTVGSPVAGAGLVFATCGEGKGGHWMVAIRPAEAGKPAQVVYKIPEQTPYVPTPLVYQDLLFYWNDMGIVTCAKAATGETLWQERASGGGYYASPICVGDKLYGVSKQGDVVILSASEKFELLAKNKLGLRETVHATPAVSGGRMYLRTYTHLISVGGKK